MLATKKCLRGGAVLPLLGSLAIDTVFNRLSSLGFEVQGYTANFVIIVRVITDCSISACLLRLSKTNESCDTKV